MHNALAHTFMVQDKPRSEAFDRAIRKIVRPGDHVVDIGTGTGLLAMMAARAGAARVDAIEVGNIAHLARELIRDNGYEKIIRVRKGDAKKIKLKEKADVLLLELIGDQVYDEDIVRLILHAREHYLKPNATICPQTLDLHVAPVSAASQYRTLQQIGDAQGLNFAAARRTALNAPVMLDRPLKKFLAPLRRAVALNLQRLKTDPFPLEQSITHRIETAGTVHGWYGCFYSKLAPGITITNHTKSHWHPMLFPIAEPWTAKAGDRVRIDLTIDESARYTWTAYHRRGRTTVAQSTHSHIFADAKMVQTLANMQRRFGK